MNRFMLLLSSAMLMVAPIRGHADQQVTLKSGTRLVGDVSIDEETVTVQVDDLETAIPMSKVELIGPVSDDAEHLLLLALESRLQLGSGEGHVELLADAHRKSPENARIAYWYASSLSDAGQLSTAQKIIEDNRDAIEKTYPGMADQLAKSIRERSAIENTPGSLRTRINRINATAPKSKPGPEGILRYAHYHLIDQNGLGIDSSKFDIGFRGSIDELEDFGDGYYLITSPMSEGFKNLDAKLKVVFPGYELKEFTVRAATDHVEDAGEFVVHRYGEDEKVDILIDIVDQQNSPVLNADVTLFLDSGAGIYTDDWSPEVKQTDENGRVEFSAYPLKYFYRVFAKHFNEISGRVDVPPRSKPIRYHNQLYDKISAKIRAEWDTFDNPNMRSRGRIVSEYGKTNPYSPANPDDILFLHPVQIDDFFTLQGSLSIVERYEKTTCWIGRISEESIDKEPLEYFKQIDLATIDDLREEAVNVAMTSEEFPMMHEMFTIPIKKGEVYVGKLPNFGRGLEDRPIVNFKLYVEDISTASP